MTPPTEKPFEPTPEQVEEVANFVLNVNGHLMATEHGEPLGNLTAYIYEHGGQAHEQAKALSTAISTLRSQLDALKAEVGRKDEALSKVWAECEMGWLTNGPTTECAECGEKTWMQSQIAIIHKDDCLQFLILKALTPATKEAGR